MFTLMFVAVVLTVEMQRRHERVLRSAIAKSGQTMQQASMEADLDQGQFTRQIQLIEGSLKRLAMQPAAFWQWWAIEIAAEFGLPSEVETAAKLSRMVGL